MNTLTKWRLRSCPHCIRGDLNYNPYTKEWDCLQCGYVEPPQVMLKYVDQGGLHNQHYRRIAKEVR